MLQKWLGLGLGLVWDYFENNRTDKSFRPEHFRPFPADMKLISQNNNLTLIIAEKGIKQRQYHLWQMIPSQ